MKLNLIALALATGSVLSMVPVSQASAAGATRTVVCEMREVPTVQATVILEDDNGQEVLKSIAIADLNDPSFKQGLDVNGTLTEKNVTATPLYKNSTHLQGMFDTYLKPFDTADLYLAKDGSKTAEEILESIADDAAGLFYAEAQQAGKMTGGILLAGWGGFYVNCVQK